jgi:paraquat-inducible protein B
MDQTTSDDDAPVAHVRPSRLSVRSLFGPRLSWWWLVTLGAVALAVVLVVTSWRTRGPRISVRFEHGHSIEPGDRLRHRGIEVGEVTSVTLDEDLRGVRVQIALDAAAAGLAREGSRFWIERPQISLSRVSGLETIVGGQYLAVLPGPAATHRNGYPARRTQFDGLETPPIGELAEGGLEILLEADQLGGLHPRAPVTYRGIQVGRILAVGLATDAATITAQAYIEPAYVRLVRDNTRFWRRGGVDMSVGFSGVQIDVESLSSVAIGGVSLATEDPPGELVRTGHTFVLHAKAEDDWLAWRPRVPVGSELLPGDLPLPQPVRASLKWRERRFAIKRSRQRQGWVLPLEGNRLLGPSSLLAPQLAEETSPTLEVAGRMMELSAGGPEDEEDAQEQPNALAVLDVGERLNVPRAWPVSRIRSPTKPEDVLIVGATDTTVVPVSASRLTPQASVWHVDATLPLTKTDHHGACVIAIEDGSLIGLTVIDDQGYVSLVTPELHASLE